MISFDVDKMFSTSFDRVRNLTWLYELDGITSQDLYIYKREEEGNPTFSYISEHNLLTLKLETRGNANSVFSGYCNIEL